MRMIHSEPVASKDHAQRARDREVRISEGVLAPGSAISVEMSVFASSADILGGYQVDCISAASIRPKDRAIDKLFLSCLVSIAPTHSHLLYGSAYHHWSICIPT
jgi:hypothetical protein